MISTARGGCCVGLLLLISSAATSPAEELPFGIEQRTPWTNTRLLGSPEPPLPYRTEPVFTGVKFKQPLYIVAQPGLNRMLVVEQSARVLAVENKPDVAETQVFLQVPDSDIYSIHFDPQFAENGFVYVFNNGNNSTKVKQNRILRYHVSTEAPYLCEPDTKRVMIEWSSNGHNGGELAFGPDGYLYISTGDGTSDSDGDLTGQKIDDLVSGVLRIDVRNPDPFKGYSVPKDNPFLNIPGARPELWAYGFRNPWRMCFDRAGRLWVGDIGQDLWEMIVLVERGGNYGWSVREGSHPFYPERQAGPTPISPPLIEHPHSEARSITGGIVYYGAKFPDLQGAYIYGDYSTGKVWAARYDDGRATWHEIADTTLQILGFADDPQGNIFLVDYGGQIHRLEPALPKDPGPPFPTKLSETGLFASVAGHQTLPGLIAYTVNSPLWSDGATKERFIAIPDDKQVETTADNDFVWKFPENTVLVKTFSLDVAGGAAGAPRRIETRLLTLQQKEWIGYSYLWNAEQTDAELVPAAGADRIYTVRDARAPGGERQQVWHYPSRAECMVCHSRAASYVLGVNTQQLNRVHNYGTVSDNQLRALAHAGVLKVNGKMEPGKEPWAADSPRLTDPADATASLEARARSYLHANCAQCHVAAGGGNSAIDLHVKTATDKTGLVDGGPRHNRFGLDPALLVTPGDPEHSILLHRVATTDKGRMPPLSSALVDEPAAELLREWIKSLKK